MIIDDKIRDEKSQYDINRAAAKVSVLSSDKIDRYEYQTNEEILPPQQHKLIEHAKFLIHHLERPPKNKERLLKSRRESNLKRYNPWI